MNLGAEIAVALAVISGCDYAFRLDPVPLPADDSGSDAAPSYDCVFDGPPTVLPGFNMDVRDPSQRDDKLELWFARYESGDLNMYVARRAQLSEPYSGITAALELSSAAHDSNPTIQPGGLRMFLLSLRLPQQELFEATRSAVSEPFRQPVIVGTGPTYVSGYDVSPDGQTLYTNNGLGELRVLTRAGDTGDFGGVEPVGVAMPIDDPSLPDDALTIYYDRDVMIYRQTRSTAVPPTTPFSDETLIGPGSDPDISADGKTLIFESASGFSMLECP